MTPTKKKLALIEHITALEGEKLNTTYQQLLGDEEAEQKPEPSAYVVEVRVPAADWELTRLFLERMKWDFTVLHYPEPAMKSWLELIDKQLPDEWTEKEIEELVNNDL